MTRNPGYLYLLVAFLCTSTAAVAFTEEDKNITITSQKDRYEFVTGDKENPVNIRQASEVIYRCNQFRTNVSYVEFYDDRSTIDEVRPYVNGVRAKALKPVFRNYSVDDIFYSDAKVCLLELPLEKAGTESRVELDIALVIPKGYTLEGADKLNRRIDNECGSFTVSATLEADKLTLHIRKVYKNSFEPVAKWGNLLQVIDVATDFGSQKVLLKKA